MNTLGTDVDIKILAQHEFSWDTEKKICYMDNLFSPLEFAWHIRTQNKTHTRCHV